MLRRILVDSFENVLLEALEDPKEDPALEDTKSESSWFDPELYGSESEAEAVPEEGKKEHFGKNP